MKIMLDADSDGWFVGGDNVTVRVDRKRGLAERNLLQCAEPGRWAFDQPESAPESMFEVSSSEDGGFSVTILPHPQSGFEGAPGESIGFLIAIDPGTEMPHGDGRRGLLTVFEPHTFFRTKLPMTGHDAPDGR